MLRETFWFVFDHEWSATPHPCAPSTKLHQSLNIVDTDEQLKQQFFFIFTT